MPASVHSLLKKKKKKRRLHSHFCRQLSSAGCPASTRPPPSPATKAPRGRGRRPAAALAPAPPGGSTRRTWSCCPPLKKKKETRISERREVHKIRIQTLLFFSTTVEGVPPDNRPIRAFLPKRTTIQPYCCATTNEVHTYTHRVCEVLYLCI